MTIFDYFSLFLTIFDYFWLFWLFLTTFDYFWPFLTIFDHFWLFLTKPSLSFSRKRKMLFRKSFFWYIFLRSRSIKQLLLLFRHFCIIQKGIIQLRKFNIIFHFIFRLSFLLLVWKHKCLFISYCFIKETRAKNAQYLGFAKQMCHRKL